MKRCLVLTLFACLCALPASAASVWQAASVGVAGQSAWLDGGGFPSFTEFEVAGKGALGLTPHVALVGTAAYGVNRPYLRSSVGARITATDVNDPTFSVGIGASRWFINDEADGIDEWAGEAAVGWRPLPRSKIILTALSAYGVNSHKSTVTVGLVWPLKEVK